MKKKITQLAIVLALVLAAMPLSSANAQDPYADVWLSYTEAPGVGDTHDDPADALGAPDTDMNDPVPDRIGYVSLGNGGGTMSDPNGQIALAFTNNVIVDGPGDDLLVYEIGWVEDGIVDVSDDGGVTWVRLGLMGGSGLVSSFDLADSGLTCANAVRITDDLGYATKFPWAGVDIDAVEALNWAETCELTIDIEKATNGEDADDLTGPEITVGDPVTWTYKVCNTNGGNIVLTGIVVTDDILGEIGTIESLEPGECVTLTVSGGVAEAGQYENEGCVSAWYNGIDDGIEVTDCDLSHYIGIDPAVPAIEIEKATNGQDADAPTGPEIPVGDPVTWTYVVCNTGNVELTGIVVTDDILGEIGTIASLAPGACETLEAYGFADEAGQYENEGCVSASYDTTEVTDCDLSHYLGQEPDDPGEGYCGLTQGFWGNEGGKFMGKGTAELIDELLVAGGDVVVGVLGEHSITFDSSACIILRLPAGGKAAALSGGDLNCDSLPGLTKKKKPEINNVLVGQVVALSLNVRIVEEGYNGLGEFVLPEGYFCTIGEEEGDCPEQYIVADSLVGLTVDELLALANNALAGLDGDATIGEINDAVSAINEAFDECRLDEDCAETETDCDDGCDNDFDGDIDCADDDCCGIGECEPCPEPAI